MDFVNKIDKPISKIDKYVFLKYLHEFMEKLVSLIKLLDANTTNLANSDVCQIHFYLYNEFSPLPFSRTFYDDREELLVNYSDFLGDDKKEEFLPLTFFSETLSYEERYFYIGEIKRVDTIQRVLEILNLPDVSYAKELHDRFKDERRDVMTKKVYNHRYFDALEEVTEEFNKKWLEQKREEEKEEEDELQEKMNESNYLSIVYRETKRLWRSYKSRINSTIDIEEGSPSPAEIRRRETNKYLVNCFDLCGHELLESLQSFRYILYQSKEKKKSYEELIHIINSLFGYDVKIERVNYNSSNVWGMNTVIPVEREEIDEKKHAAIVIVTYLHLASRRMGLLEENKDIDLTVKNVVENKLQLCNCVIV